MSGEKKTMCFSAFTLGEEALILDNNGTLMRDGETGLNVLSRYKKHSTTTHNGGTIPISLEIVGIRPTELSLEPRSLGTVPLPS